MGIAWTTNLIKVSLPAFDISFSFHPISFFVIYSWISLKVPTFDFPPTMGKPRYFSQLFMTCAPIKFLISSFSLRLVFWLKKNVVFDLFMACLETSSYCVSISSNWRHSLILLHRTIGCHRQREGEKYVPHPGKNKCTSIDLYLLLSRSKRTAH